MKRELILTADGSKTIYIPEMDENYHSTHGALQEAMHVFIQNGLQAISGQKEIIIFEMGFGTGLNALLSMVEAEKSKSQIKYYGIEAFPVEIQLIKEIGYEKLVDNNFIEPFFLMHSTTWNSDHKLMQNFMFHKIDQKIEDYVPVKDSVDIIYFDAFGPRVQQGMWNPEILNKMFLLLKPGGSLVTYCAQGQVKRDLRSVGFKVEGLPGPPGKREMTRAIKLSIDNCSI